MRRGGFSSGENNKLSGGFERNSGVPSGRRRRLSSWAKVQIVLPAVLIVGVLVLLVFLNGAPTQQIETDVAGQIELADVLEEATEPARIEIIRCDVLTEELEIVNSGDQTVTLEGWVLHDEGRVWETDLDPVTMGPGEHLILLSGDQSFALEGMYRWTFGNVWNNRGGDVATLIRPDGLVVETFDCI